MYGDAQSSHVQGTMSYKSISLSVSAANTGFHSSLLTSGICTCSATQPIVLISLLPGLSPSTQFASSVAADKKVSKDDFGKTQASYTVWSAPFL